MHEITLAFVNASPGGVVDVLLWIAQSLIFALFVFAGIMKSAMPVRRLAKIWPWTGQVPGAFLRFIAVVDLAGGVGVLVPAITRILPHLTAIAALGCGLLQLLAIGFHVRRHEASATPFNFVVLALCAFVGWGR